MYGSRCFALWYENLFCILISWVLLILKFMPVGLFFVRSFIFCYFESFILFLESCLIFYVKTVFFSHKWWFLIKFRILVLFSIWKKKKHYYWRNLTYGIRRLKRLIEAYLVLFRNKQRAIHLSRAPLIFELFPPSDYLCISLCPSTMAYEELEWLKEYSTYTCGSKLYWE